MRLKTDKHSTTVSREDSELFRSSVGPVKRVRHDRVQPAGKHPPPVARFRKRDEASAIQDLLSDQYDASDLETGDELIFARPGLQYRLLGRLRRGQFVVDAECDLHGLTVPEARRTLIEFLNRASRRHCYCVRVIHGKGLGSRHRIPVLKHKVNTWLRQCHAVLAFSSARQIDGGTGAVYVLLRRNR
jgi:DNA-nicking Smr family endonuclease